MTKSVLLAAVALVMGCGFVTRVEADVSAGVVFTKDEIRIIAGWYDEHVHDAGVHGKGKGKPKGLPPGIQRNLARGKALPPGIAKQHLPDGLVRLLPVPPRGFERVVVDGKVLLVEVATQVIHDILTDIVLN